MRLLTEKVAYDDTIHYAKQLAGAYDTPSILHCYWNTTRNGGLSEKHLYSILSCYYFNVHNNKHKIILWLENVQPNTYNDEIKQYAEIRHFDIAEQTKNTFLENYTFKYQEGQPGVKYYSDYVRLVLLYKYGGCWFDMDCFFLRCFDPLFAEFSNDLCAYQWEWRNHPANANILSLEPKSRKLEEFIRFTIKRNRGWGFMQARLTYDLDVDLLVLPCSWFNPGWVANVGNRVNKEDFLMGTDKVYNFDNFYSGAFCYHWFNGWNLEVGNTSIISQLVKIIKDDIG